MKLLIDTSYLCYRAYFTTGSLSVNKNKTGIIFGFFHSLLHLAKEFKTTDFIFCFDSNKSLRKRIYPQYKEKRKSALSDKDRASIQKQIKEIYSILPELGFNNVFRYTGYEADDIIAYLAYLNSYARCGSNNSIDFTIISTDQDLYQLLYYVNGMYDIKNKKIYTYNNLIKDHGICSTHWAKVKAIAGCASDNVKGVSGIGEKTAIKYIRQIASKNQIEKIESNKEIISRNSILVTLPFKDKKFNIELNENNINRDKLIEVFDKYRFNSFLKRSKLKEWYKYFKI